MSLMATWRSSGLVTLGASENLASSRLHIRSAKQSPGLGFWLAWAGRCEVLSPSVGSICPRGAVAKTVSF